MADLSDREVHQLLEELLEIDEDHRVEWLRERVPSDSDLRRRLLAAAHAAAGDLPAFVAPAPPSQPEQVGRYRIIGPLGRGGMGTVFLAEDPDVRRKVAVKLLSTKVASAEELARFRREARTTGGLSHDNIVRIYDVQEHEGRPCIVMEYLHGQTLSDVIAQQARLPIGHRDRWSVRQKLRVIEQLCAGLECAHGAGIIHRDIKPANLILDSTGTLKIVDFGIGKDTTSRPRDTQTLVTAHHILMGTSGYISPEHLSGAQMDARSDMFAAAVVAFELLSGQKPFGSEREESARRTVRGDVAPFSEGVDLSTDLQEAVLKGLAASPGDRYRDMAAMRRRFEEIRLGLSVVPDLRFGSDAGNTSSAPKALSVGAVGLLIVLVAATGWWSQRRVATRNDAGAVDARAVDEISRPPEPVTDATKAPTLTSRVNPRPERTGSASPSQAAEAPASIGSDLAVQGTSATATNISSPPETTPLSIPKEAGNSNGRTSDGAEGLTNPGPDAFLPAIRRLEDAVRGLSSAAMKQAYPSLTQDELRVWDRRFADNSEYELDVTIQAVTPLPSGRVQLNCTISHRPAARQGPSRPKNGPAVVLVERQDDEWRIASVNGPGW